MGDPNGVGKFQCCPTKQKRRGTRFSSYGLYVVESERPQPNAEGLHHGLFCGKTSGITFRWIMALVSIGSLASGETLDERGGATKDLAHSVNFNSVNPDAHNHVAI
jgi:hypothetical protein